MAAVLALLAAQAQAFDSDAWHARRDRLTREAERLRAVYSNCLERAVSPAEDVVVPVEVFKDGAVKTVVAAKKAQYCLDSGLIWAAGVTVRRFREDGAPDGQIEAANCVIDRKSKCGWAEGPAKVAYGETTIRGTGVYFSTDDSYVKVFDGAAIASRNLEFGGFGK